MMTATQPATPAVLREAAEAQRTKRPERLLRHPASLNSLSVSAEAARVAVDTASNTFLCAEAALLRAADALEASSD